ncbi:MAG: hypothetical protein EXR86_12460 [Gammaproteobacteria bacterium]|nr:hypothetical protein [Gammaproteobacteria bacterium]
MGTTREEICNDALSHIQVSETIEDVATDSSKAGIVCRLWYSRTLSFALEDFDWNFARRRATGALISSTQKPDYWTYAYGYPSGALVIRGVEFPGYRTVPEELRIRFEVAAENGVNGDYRVIYTNQADVIFRYTKDVTDAGMFDSHFAIALSWLLAAHIGGPISAKKALVEDANRTYQSMRVNAFAHHLGEGLEELEPISETELCRNA